MPERRQEGGVVVSSFILTQPWLRGRSLQWGCGSARTKERTERGVQGWIRWGTEPAVQTTHHTWLAELERRIDELTCIADALEKGRRI